MSFETRMPPDSPFPILSTLNCFSPQCQLEARLPAFGADFPCLTATRQIGVGTALAAGAGAVSVRPLALARAARTMEPRQLPSRMTVDQAPTYRLRAILLVAMMAGLFILAWSDPVHRAVLQVFEAAKAVMAGHPFLGPTLFLLLSAVAAMLAFVSSAVLVPPAVYAWGPVACAALLWAGWMLGGLASYGLAYRFGRPVLRWLAPGKSIARYQRRIRREASFGFILLFQLALPSEIPGLVLGLARFPVERYLAALALAELPYAVGTTLLGASFVSRRFGLLLSLGAVAALTAFVLGRAFRRRLGTPRRPA